MSEEKTVTGKAFDLKLLRRILTYARPYKLLFRFTLFTVLLLAGIATVRPLLTKDALNECVMHGNYSRLGWYTLIMAGWLCAEAVLQYLNSYNTSLLGQNIIRDMRVQLYTQITNFRPKFFDKTPIGQLVTRTISDIEAISDIFSQGFITIMGDILTLIVYVITMFAVNWKLTLITLSTVPVLLIATNVFKNAVRSAFQDVRTQVARLNTFVQEHLTGMNIVQIFNREEEEMKKFEKINAAHRDANIRSVWAYSIFFPVVEILSSVSLALLVWQGGLKVYRSEISLGEITFFIMLINMLFRPIRMLADRINTLQMGMVASERVFRVLDTDAVIANAGTIQMKEPRGEVEFRNVWFAYDNENYVLKDVSFKIRAGETLALVGATGAGKSSVINLINRFYKFQKGAIYIDGTDIREYELSSLRSNTGLVLQDVFLFSGSILNNITLDNPDISREAVMRASKLVGAHEFIMRLPGDYDFNVMERGAMLSVGQRQLISFIRAYVYNPRILILDEATSSIDSESETLIQHATEKLTQNRTAIVIAHRLSTIQKADRILVLDKGEIIEEGSHQQLLALNGHYKKLYELQFKGQDVAV